MMDPASYLLISNTNNLNSNGTIGGLANINSLSDFEQSTSDASSGSPSHYGDPFVGGLSYFDQPTGAATTTSPTTTLSRTPTLSSAATAANALSQHHNHHLQLHHHQNQNHHRNSLHSHNHHHHHSNLLTSSSSMMLNINNFSFDQLVDHNVVDNDLDHNSSSMPYLDQTQLDHTDATSSLMIDGCELDEDDDDLIHGTLNSFACTDLGSESDNGYTSGVSDGLFTSSSSLVDCPDSIAAADSHCFKQFSFSDLHGLIDVGNSTPKQLASSTEKRSVLMNLLIYGSDIGAGYTSIRR